MSVDINPKSRSMTTVVRPNPMLLIEQFAAERRALLMALMQETLSSFRKPYCRLKFWQSCLNGCSLILNNKYNWMASWKCNMKTTKLTRCYATS
jgi:hypothetical protein